MWDWAEAKSSKQPWVPGPLAADSPARTSLLLKEQLVEKVKGRNRRNQESPKFTDLSLFPRRQRYP